MVAEKNIKDVVMSESENLMGKRDTRGKFWVRTVHTHTWLLYWHRETLVRPPTFKFYKDICTVTQKFVQRHYAGAEETLVRPEETRGRGLGKRCSSRRYSQVLEL